MAARVRLPKALTHQAFITAVKGMLAKAETQKELLIGKGMSETLLGDLTTALGEFETTLEMSRTSRRDHVGASADLKAGVGGDPRPGPAPERPGARPVRGQPR